MCFTFRPLPLFTLAAAAAFALLVSLGVWQVERLHWKLALIAEVNRNLSAPSVTLAEAMALGEGAQYRRVTLTGRFDHTKEAYVFSTGPGGAPVYHVLTPFLAGGRTLLVDRGIVPPELRDPAKRAAGLLKGEQRVTGVWRKPEAPGFFTPKPDRARRIWYSRDVAAIAAADRITLAAPVVVEADATPNPGGWPRGGETQVTFRNEHLQYAITWFALAAALLGVFLAYHIKKGRLGISRRDAG